MDDLKDSQGVFKFLSDAGGLQCITRRECIMLLTAIRSMADLSWKRGEIATYTEWDTLRGKIAAVRSTDPILKGDKENA